MKTWNFVKNEECWWVVISDLEQLLEYDNLTNDRYARAVVTKNENHKLLKYAEVLAENKGISLIQGMLEVRQRIIEKQTQYILEGKTLYINEYGGYNFGFKPIKSVFIDKLLYPDYTKDDIKVSQWGKGEGFHWYARVGEIEVKDGDKMKWDTFQEAYDEALKYISV